MPLYKAVVKYKEDRYYTIEADSPEEVEEKILNWEDDDFEICNEDLDIKEIEEVEE